ncbi:MAG: hypothetical protein IKX51_04550, partial [Bacteroidales bacterium]|nr:hypothetical protein [Bacteroidales bacterium]
MNMLTYFLKGKTQYQLHSPFVFNMYNEVLLPKVNVSAIHTRNLSRNDRRNAAIIFKIADYYGIKAIAFERNTLGNDFAHWLECDLSQLSKTEVVEYMGGGVGENTILLCGADAFFKFKEQTDSHFPH